MHGTARSHLRAWSWNFVALLLLNSGVLLAQPASPDDGPAARQFASWLALFNKGDRAALEEYHRQSFSYLVAPPELGNIERELSMSLETGGLDIRKREWGSATRFSAVLSDRATHQFVRATMRVEAATPHRVLEFALVPIATPAEYQVPEGALDAKRRRALIDAAARAIEANYVFPDLGRRMAAALRERGARGDYEHISDCAAFAARLTDDLRALCHDKHLRVTYKEGLQLPPSDGGGQGLGFGEIERFRGNIVRISIGGFPPVRRARDAIAAFMSDVADADALILDLRANHGGDPSTVTLVASYLFDDQPVHLNDVIERDGTTRTFWTQPSVAGKRFGGKKPVYVLTSAETFSGGEGLAYDLQSLHRATLIGETTGGGANLTRGHTLDDWFVIGVPYARAVNPVTKTNWEGVGVRPDVATKATAALDEALRRAALDIGFTPARPPK
ncbi:MAG TPA: S41 family peptidase [Myxococcaceae bacterium]|nr:S41 family peptidase [Myxococcaceae bacterium]